MVILRPRNNPYQFSTNLNENSQSNAQMQMLQIVKNKILEAKTYQCHSCFDSERRLVFGL